jgi:hypothetical protein
MSRPKAHRRKRTTIITITIITIIIITTGDLRDATRWMAPLIGAIFLCGVTKLLTANLARRPNRR